MKLLGKKINQKELENIALYFYNFTTNNFIDNITPISGYLEVIL